MIRLSPCVMHVTFWLMLKFTVISLDDVEMTFMLTPAKIDSVYKNKGM